MFFVHSLGLQTSPNTFRLTSCSSVGSLPTNSARGLVHRDPLAFRPAPLADSSRPFLRGDGLRAQVRSPTYKNFESTLQNVRSHRLGSATRHCARQLEFC